MGSVSEIHTGDHVADGPAGPTPHELAATAFNLATVDPEKALAASSTAEDAARRSRDWRAVSVARRARGVAQIQLRRLDEAVGSLRAAIEAARRADEPALAGQASMSLGPALMLRGQPGRGLSAVSRAVAELQGVQAARARVQRAAMLQHLGRFDESIQDTRAALPVLRRSEDTEWEVRALTNRSNVYVARRQLGQAEADLLRTRQLCEEHGLYLAGAYAEENLGCVYAARGDIPGALECFANAESRYESLGLDVASLLLDRATALLSVRLLEEAREAAERALSLFRSQQWTVEVPEAQLLVSTTALLQGDRESAIAAASEATVSLRKLGRAEWLPLARYATLQGQLAPAADIDQGSAGPAQPIVPASRVRAVADQLEAAGWTVPALEARVLAARTALAEGRTHAARRDLEQAARARRAGPAEARIRAWIAEALLREAEGARGGAKRALRAALRTLDEHRISLGAAELRAHVSVFRSAPAQIGLRLAVEDRDPAAVHWWGERRRASADLMRSALPPSDPTLARLLEELRGTMTDIGHERSAGRTTQGLVGRQVQLERSIRDFARRHPSSVAQTAPVPPLRDLAADLGDSALVEYVDDGTDLMAVSLVGGHAGLHPLGPSVEVRHALRHLPFALRRMVQPYGSRPPDTAIAVVDHAVEVFQQRLLDPIAHLVADRPLLVVPTGWLQGLPWSMLPGCVGRPVTVAPSATLWKTARDRPRRDDGAVVVIAGPQLPGAALEAHGVAALYRDPILLEGGEAVARRVGAVIGSAATCHIAAHGSVRPDNPLFSSLLLDDGPFTVFDLEQLGATPRHVVLAACESGVSKVTPGQEILGLTAALLSRQTATVVAPIVAIDDAETSPMMVGYHRGLLAGRCPAEALADVQAEHSRGDPRARATAAAFICLGVGDQLSWGAARTSTP